MWLSCFPSLFSLFWALSPVTAAVSPLLAKAWHRGDPVQAFRLDAFSDDLPQANATGNIQSGIMAGKLKGVMPTQTPNGNR